MRNSLIDLNNHLFEALERLNDEDLTKDELEKEVKRSKSIQGIAKNIIDNARLSLDAQKHKDEYAYSERKKDIPEMFLLKGDSK